MYLESTIYLICIFQVKLSELNLNDTERLIFIRMVGPRFFQPENEVKLVTSRFPNRIENKKYLIYLLEILLLETRRLYREKDILSVTPPPPNENGISESQSKTQPEMESD